MDRDIKRKDHPYRPRSATAFGEVQELVVDPGTDTIRCGWSKESQPRLETPCLTYEQTYPAQPERPRGFRHKSSIPQL